MGRMGEKGQGVVKFGVWVMPGENQCRAFLWSPPTLINTRYLSDQTDPCLEP